MKWNRQLTLQYFSSERDWWVRRKTRPASMMKHNAEVANKLCWTTLFFQTTADPFCFSSVCRTGIIEPTCSSFGWHLSTVRPNRKTRNTEYWRRNSQLRNYTEECNFRMQHLHWLWHWTTSPVLSSSLQEISRTPTRLSNYTQQTIPLINILRLFSYIIDWCIFQLLPVSPNSVPQGSLLYAYKKQVPYTLVYSEGWTLRSGILTFKDYGLKHLLARAASQFFDGRFLNNSLTDVERLRNIKNQKTIETIWRSESNHW